MQLKLEQALIGGIIGFNEEAVKMIGSSVDTGMFQFDNHREIISAVNYLHLSNIPVDLITVAEQLHSRGSLEYVGGIEYLTSIIDECIVSSHIWQYFLLCKKSTGLLMLLEKLTIIKENKENLKFEEILSLLKEEIQKIEKRFSITLKPKTTLELLIQAEADKNENPAPKTLFTKLNTLLNEKTPKQGHLWIVGAYQKVGKTSLSVQFAHNFITQGKTVRFISLEMANIELAERLDRYNNFIKKPINKDIYNNFVISELKAPTLEQVVSEIESCEEEIIFVDYLQIISSTSSEREAMEKFPMVLKNSARQSGKIIIALSQTSNEAATAPTRKKTPFKGSANIGAAADLGIALYRDLDKEADETETIVDAQLDVIINRHGRSGVCQIAFDRDSGFFVPFKPQLGFEEKTRNNF